MKRRFKRALKSIFWIVKPATCGMGRSTIIGNPLSRFTSVSRQARRFLQCPHRQWLIFIFFALFHLSLSGFIIAKGVSNIAGYPIKIIHILFLYFSWKMCGLSSKPFRTCSLFFKGDKRCAKMYNLVQTSGFLNRSYDKIPPIKKAYHAIKIDVCLALRNDRLTSSGTLVPQLRNRQRRFLPWK